MAFWLQNVQRAKFDIVLIVPLERLVSCIPILAYNNKLV